jgi:hypothetical protein
MEKNKLFSVNPKNVLKVFMFLLAGAIVHGLINVLFFDYPAPYPLEEWFRLLVCIGVFTAISYVVMTIKICRWMHDNQRQLNGEGRSRRNIITFQNR